MGCRSFSVVNSTQVDALGDFASPTFTRIITSYLYGTGVAAPVCSSNKDNFICGLPAQEATMNQRWKRDDLWSIILAGGEGERLRPLMQQWLGQHKPKQYCTFIGTRSMLQHTLDRADQISDPKQKVTVIARSHRGHAWPQLARRKNGKVILQPANRDTAGGIFAALSYVRTLDPQATVVIYPSDHFVYPEYRFVETVRSAAYAARQLKPGCFCWASPRTGWKRNTAGFARVRILARLWGINFGACNPSWKSRAIRNAQQPWLREHFGTH